MIRSYAKCWLSVCPYDANPSIIDISAIRLNTVGGSGVALELCKLLGVENK